MAIQKHFDDFNERIYLTFQSPKYKKARDKDNSIFDDIKKEFKNAGYPVDNTFKQGSFAVNTAINSLDGDFDIDRAIVINAEDAPADPVEPKKLILDVLKKRNFKEPRIKKPCVTADYKSTNLHIDYVVYKKEETILGDEYEIAIGKLGSSDDNKEWSESDPKGLIDWIEQSGNYGFSQIAKRKQYKRLVRYMKRWRDVQFSNEVGAKIYSIGLTVMLKEQYSPVTLSSELEDDLTVLKKIVDDILLQNYLRYDGVAEGYRIYVKLPVKPTNRDIFQHKTSGGDSNDGSDLNTGNQFRNKLLNLQSKLQNAIDEADEIKQCKILNKLFGDDFKVPENKNKKSSTSVAGASILSSSGASGTSQGA